MAIAGEPAAVHGEQAELYAFIRDVLPRQGCWNEDAYLWLTDQTRRLVELADGRIDVLPMPTDGHQGILHYLNEVFSAFVHSRGGKVRFAPLRLRVRDDRFREPDLLLVKEASDPRRRNRFWSGADVVVEVVSPDRPERDLVDKRHDYAEAGIPEYWIVDPTTDTVTVLKLVDDAYVERGVFGRGTLAGSAVLDGFSLNVTAAFDAGATVDD